MANGSRPRGRQLARPVRLERTAFGFGGQRSIQLSYGRLGMVILTENEVAGDAGPSSQWQKSACIRPPMHPA